MATTQTTAPMARATGRVTSNRPVDWPTARKIRGRMTAPPSWLASWVLVARAETRTITPRPSVATAGATQKMTTTHSLVGTMRWWATGQAVTFTTTAKQAKPIQEIITAGTKAPNTLATNRSRSG